MSFTKIWFHINQVNRKRTSQPPRHALVLYKIHYSTPPTHPYDLERVNTGIHPPLCCAETSHNLLWSHSFSHWAKLKIPSPLPLYFQFLPLFCDCSPSVKLTNSSKTNKFEVVLAQTGSPPHPTSVSPPRFPPFLWKWDHLAWREISWVDEVSDGFFFFFCVRSDAQRDPFLAAPLHSVRGEGTGQTGLCYLFILPSVCVVFLSDYVSNSNESSQWS